MRIDLSDVVKAGAFVRCAGRFVCMFGFNEKRDTLRVVRLGGHMEMGETPLTCAIREVREESGLIITPVDALVTYADTVEGTYAPAECAAEHGVRPLLLKCQSDWPMAGKYTAMYLANGEGTPTPQMETQGLLLLTEKSLQTLTAGGATLADLRVQGADAILAQPLPEDVPLVATPQVQFLHWWLAQGGAAGLWPT